MSHRLVRRGGWSLLALVLAGCASYRSEPLQPAVDDALRGPALGAMIAPASSLQRGFLKPVMIDPSAPLTPDALAVIAVMNNPDLKAARAKAAVSTAQVFQAGLLPDPTVNLSYDHHLSGPDPTNGWAAALAYELTALRDRGADVAAARAAERQVRLDLAWQEWQAAEQAKLLAVRLAALQTIHELDAESKASADAALARALRAASIGDVKADEVEARRLAAIDAAGQFTQVQRDLAGARLDLNKLLGLTPDTLLTIAVTPQQPDAQDAATLFKTALGRRLDLRALEAGYASQDASVRKAILDQFPSFQLTINRAQDTANNQTLGPAVSFTLPIWNRNRGGVPLAEATREQLRAEYAARVFATRADIADLTQSLALAESQSRAVNAQISALAATARQTEAAAARGDVALASAEASRQTLRDKQSALAALQQSIAEQSISLELATGGPLS